MGALSGSSVVVTGAGRGLGRAYAHAIAAAGGAVVVNDVLPEAAFSTTAEIRSAGGEAISVVGSVADWDFCEHLIAETRRCLGGLDGLVSNAAITRHSPPWDESEEDLRAVAEVNILGTQFIGRHAMRAMVDLGKGGSILSVISGAYLGIPGMSSYGASKGAVASMTLNWAAEGRKHGIRANAIAPLARTAMALADPRARPPHLPPPEDIAPLVVALLSEEARDINAGLFRFDGQTLGAYGTMLSSINLQDGVTHGSVLDALRNLEAPSLSSQSPPSSLER